MAEALTGRHLHADTGISVARIPPVVPYIRFDGGGLSLAKSARPSAALHGQFTLKNGETLDECGMAVFANDPRPEKREQFGDHPALGVLVRKLKNRGAFPCYGVFPDLADLDRCAIGRRVRVRMRENNSASGL